MWSQDDELMWCDWHCIVTSSNEIPLLANMPGSWCQSLSMRWVCILSCFTSNYYLSMINVHHFTQWCSELGMLKVYSQSCAESNQRFWLVLNLDRHYLECHKHNCHEILFQISSAQILNPPVYKFSDMWLPIWHINWPVHKSFWYVTHWLIYFPLLWPKI